MSSRVVPVGLIVSYLQELIGEDVLLSDVWVEGEVSEFFRARSGHVYFTLNDGDAALKCVLFRTLAERQANLPGIGDQIVAHGRVGLYEQDGRVQLYTDVVQAAGLGVLALQFEQLRQRLAADGLFEESRKRSLPPRPRVIGVVTSPDGSVWHDIQQVLQRRYPLVEVVLAPSLVQGEFAPGSIVVAMEAIQRRRDLDLIIVGRGGGSPEDLAAFNDERVARAVFASRVPVISAVGHETDWTIIDFVADLRAATPSVAAELCVPSAVELMEQTRIVRSQLDRGISALVERDRRDLTGYRNRLARIDMPAALGRRRRESAAQRRDLDRCASELLRGESIYLHRQRAVLATLGPRSVLGRGYAVVMDQETNMVLSSGVDAANCASLRIGFADAELDVRPVSDSLRQRERKEAVGGGGAS